MFLGLLALLFLQLLREEASLVRLLWGSPIQRDPLYPGGGPQF